MPDLQTLLDATAAREKLWAIPGVLRIGFGLKEKGGQVLPEYVFRVYVAAKKPGEELSPGEVIPPEVDGIPTDVVVLYETLPQCSSPMKPGAQITREAYNMGPSSGSIGCFVQKDGHYYILTNHHVFVPDQGGGDLRENVYQPAVSEVAGIKCNKPTARVVSEVPPWAVHEDYTLGGRRCRMDAGLLELKPGVKFTNEVEGVAAMGAAIRDLMAEAFVPGPAGGTAGVNVPAAAIAVHKRGATTNLTHGTIVELCREERISAQGAQPAQTFIRWELQARPTSGKAYDVTHEISPADPRSATQIVALYAGEGVTATVVNPASPLRIRFHGTLFSEGGDSGSAWVDGSGRMIGLHWGGGYHDIITRRNDQDEHVHVYNGRGAAVHAAAAFAALGLNPATAIVTGTHSSAGAVLRVPGDAVDDEDAVPTARVEEIEAALERSPLGRHLAAAVRRHQMEVRALIHHRRRVTVAWHRHKGPAFMAAVLNAVREGSTAIPTQVAEYRLVELMRALRAVLREEGSPDLRAAAEREGAMLLDLAERCATLEDVLDHLEREPADVAA